MSGGRGHEKAPGEFRRSQNWIGGTRPGNAAFVPPPHTAVQDCMSDLERFLHVQDDGMPTILRVGLAHVQFETIHPFLDGNGRVGRLLITLLLCHAGVLREPVLYLSLHFKKHRTEYYHLLNQVRRTGDWEAWLAFYLRGVKLTAEAAVTTAQSLTALFEGDRHRILSTAAGRAGSAVRVHDALKVKMYLTIAMACTETQLSFGAVSSAMEVLVANGIALEITGRRRNRVFVYSQYLEILSEEVNAS